MPNMMPRREALRLAAMAVATPSALLSLPPGAARAAEPGGTGHEGAPPPARHQPPEPESWIVKPFANSQVTLGESLFSAKRDRILAFLRAFPADRVLANFRANAGLDTLGAQPPGGWDDATGNLRGHFSGHFLSALALAYAESGDPFFKDKADYLVKALGECQDALAARVGEPAPPPVPVARVAGRSGRAVRLDGPQYVALPAGIVSGLDDFTVAVWLNPAAITTWSRIFDFGTGTSRTMFLTVSAGSGPRFAITTSGGGGEQRIDGDGRLPAGQWTHVAVTLAGGTGTLYVNGAPVGANTAMTLKPSSLGPTDANWIGKSQYGDAYLRASVDEFRIYGRALSGAEVAALASGTDGDPGAADVAWYRFDEESGDRAADSSGRGRDARLVSEPTGHPGPSHPGFLAAYPETQFILLEQYATYPAIWAPYYTCHMIMRGLLDAHEHTGNRQALDIVLKMGDWVHSRLGHLPRQQLDRMWSSYIAGEYNAMNAVMTDLYALSGKEEYLVTAKCFDNTELLAATARGEDTLDRKHANQHIPQFLGYLSLYERGQDRRYYDAAVNFWDMVVPHRVFTDGGIAGPADNGELFGARGVIVGTLGVNNAETCPVYNLLKLSRALFFHTADPKYMQYYERALHGQILASRRDADSATDPLLTYFIPMRPGSARSYGNLGTCCGGTGLESHAKFQDSIYFRSADDRTLYVNLYLASELRWPERGFTIRQATGAPADPRGLTTLTVEGAGRLAVRLRVPYWAEKGFKVLVNGTDQRVRATPGEYVTIDRHWRRGDRISISMPYSLRVEKALDVPTTQSIAYGPVPMVAKSDETTYREFSFSRDLPLSGDLAKAMTATGPMAFTTHGLPLVPFYLGDTDRYHAYFHRAEPVIAFGTADSGVPNRARADGVTFLDALWARAPFRGRGAFVAAVARTADEWVRAGLMTAAERRAVLSAALKARLPA
ncbi:beta-L-arabinofuranosidase domain-containing protein [Nonomuraea candida]|uniref:beta-L-arabinofuranosidase domain-containing protein n=1 Tax=Nonomuraea candida TaxID=359159 RepID=UPI0005B8C87F|nr:beta-L-arabinofuranosidase domain-containing protein [Nonomuraea candida]